MSDLSVKQFIAALSGSLCSLGVVYPTEVYKRSLHLNTHLPPQSRLSHPAILRKLFPFGFYKGFISCAVGTVPKNAFPLFAYPLAKRWWDERLRGASPLVSSVATGASLSILVTLSTSPTENLSLRKSNHPTESSFKFLSQGGWRGLYTGFAGFLMMDFIRIGIKFGLYSEILRRFEGFHHENAPKWMPQALSGAAASSLVALFTNPIDVAHTKFRSDYNGEKYGRSFLRALFSTRVRDLYCGFAVRALRGIPGGFVMFGVYEKMLGV